MPINNYYVRPHYVQGGLSTLACKIRPHNHCKVGLGFPTLAELERQYSQGKILNMRKAGLSKFAR